MGRSTANCPFPPSTAAGSILAGHVAIQNIDSSLGGGLEDVALGTTDRARQAWTSEVKGVALTLLLYS